MYVYQIYKQVPPVPNSVKLSLWFDFYRVINEIYFEGEKIAHNCTVIRNLFPHKNVPPTPGTYLTEKIGPPLKFLGHLVKTSYVSKLNKLKLVKLKQNKTFQVKLKQINEYIYYNTMV